MFVLYNTQTIKGLFALNSYIYFIDARQFLLMFWIEDSYISQILTLCGVHGTLHTRQGQNVPGCPNQLGPVGFFNFDTIPKEKMFGVLRL